MAKIDHTSINKIWGKIATIQPDFVIISSRSSEWSEANLHIFEDFLQESLNVVRLYPFNISEQKIIFNNYKPEEDFDTFYTEVSRFHLEDLLINPHFLKLFADGYIESNRRFPNKKAIFESAIARLAKEANPKVSSNHESLSVEQKVRITSEVFAKQLLAGAEGISAYEVTESCIYPSLATLLNGKPAGFQILSTKLFRPGPHNNCHIPMHKMVAEYCAAQYLIERSLDQSDIFRLSQCLPVIAPNSCVRDDLRGLLGWVATLGNEDIQHTIINLDPYAVLANGDPSQLASSSKHLLLSKLRELEDKDPYFRRGDYWREFSISNYFTEDMLPEVKNLLELTGDGHLRDLVLELLTKSSILPLLIDDLRKLVLAPDNSFDTRFLAGKCLFGIKSYNLVPDITTLIDESSLLSLKVVAYILSDMTLEAIGLDLLENFFQACVNLYPRKNEQRKNVIGERYFIKNLITSLDQKTTEALLDKLTKDLHCSCKKKIYDCDCLIGISKIVGLLLDRYFTITSPPFHLARLWQWMQNLHFYENISYNKSKSFEILSTNKILRNNLLSHIFSDVIDVEQIEYLRLKFAYGSHAAFFLTQEDKIFLVELAFNTNNVNLWRSFFAYNNKHFNKENGGAYPLRRKMREHALQKDIFMRVWALCNRGFLQAIRDNDNRMRSLTKRLKRNKRKEEKINNYNLQYIETNRELIESGRHWGFLREAAKYMLYPDEFKEKFKNKEIVGKALINCLDFIAPYVPDLKSLAETRCASKTLHVESILLASAIKIMSRDKDIEIIQPKLLAVLKIILHERYSYTQKPAYSNLHEKVNKMLFRTPKSAEDFLRQYLEPQLNDPKCSHPSISLLQHDDSFRFLGGELSVEWLGKYTHLTKYSLEMLFNIAAQHGDKTKLNQIILTRCTALTAKNCEEIKNLRDFWFLRAFYFLNIEIAEPFFNELKSDPNSIFLFEEISGSMNRDENSAWPSLTPHKTEYILEGFWDKWPKVDLPNSWGSDSPIQERAYRFLHGLIWSIGKDFPEEGVRIIDSLLENHKYRDVHNILKSLRTERLRQSNLMNFTPPNPCEVVKILDNNEITNVESLRKLLIEELTKYQGDIIGSEFNITKRYYTTDKKHINENSASEIIAERLQLELKHKNIIIALEALAKNRKRVDISATKIINNERKILMIEVKGQWHEELYTAAVKQLSERYSIHPDAEKQGIYLVIWFGSEYPVANRASHGIKSAQDLKVSIEQKLPDDLKNLIDIFVLDVSQS